MDVLGNPILTFSALSLIIILLGISLYMLRSRMVLLENRLLKSDESVQGGLNQLQEAITSSFEKSENSAEELLKALSGRIEASRKDVSDCVQESQRVIENSVSKLLNSSEQKISGLLSSISKNLEITTEDV